MVDLSAKNWGTYCGPHNKQETRGADPDKYMVVVMEDFGTKYGNVL